MEITTETLENAIKMYRSMSTAAKESLADEVASTQPNLLGSVIVLPRMSVSMEKTEIALETLLIIYLAFQISELKLPTISESALSRSLDCFVAEVKFSEELPSFLADDSILQSPAIKRQPALMAFALSQLQVHSSDTSGATHEKYLLLCVFNIVRSISVAL